MIYNFYIGASGATPTIGNKIPTDASITVGAYDGNGYYPITLPDTGAQFTVNIAGYLPFPLIVQPPLATASELTTVSGTLNTVSSNLTTVSGTLNTVSSNLTTVSGWVLNVHTDVNGLQSAIGGDLSSQLGELLSDIESNASTNLTTVNNHINSHFLTTDGAIANIDTDINTTAFDKLDNIVDLIGSPFSGNLAGDLLDIDNEVDVLHSSIDYNETGILDHIETILTTLGTPTVTIADDIHMIRSTGGDGDIPVLITVVNELGNKVVGAEVWITTDSEGEDTGTIEAGTVYSSSDGTARFVVNTGWYWVHMWKDGELNYKTQRIQVT